MNEVVTTNIKDMIYEVRGKQVMLDSDLARLYQCKNGTKDINKAVKRNIEKFPSDFYFQLTDEEKNNLWFQSGTANTKSRTNPYVFTELGVSMLSSVLRTEIAASMSVKIIRAFVAMRHYIGNNLIDQSYINKQLFKNIEEHDNRLKLVEDTLDKFITDDKINQVFYNGQIYDAYSCIVDIMRKAKENIIIIDNYADKSVLDMITNIKCNVTLITKTKSLINDLDIDKYNKQYKNLEIIYNDNFHDRFIILDSNVVYHLGASINHAGSRVFAINKLEDNIINVSLLDYIKKITK